MSVFLLMGVVDRENTNVYMVSIFPDLLAARARHDDIYFIDENTGWVGFGANGLIHKTSDGGNTWALKLTKVGTHFRCIGFASPARGFAGNLGVGSYDFGLLPIVMCCIKLPMAETRGKKCARIRGGRNEGALRDVYFGRESHLWRGKSAGVPLIFIKSTDGGANWTIRQSSPPRAFMNGIMDIYFQRPIERICGGHGS